MEADEIREFTEQVQEGGEANLRSVSLLICALAALVAMVTVIGHRTHTEAVLMQARASDAWNEYQAKKIRQSVMINVDQVLAALPAEAAPTRQQAIDANQKHIEKWNEELPENQKKATEFEDEVRKAEHKATRFDLGEPLLQIAVVLCTVTLLTRQRLYVTLGAILGFAGLLIAASAFLIR